MKNPIIVYCTAPIMAAERFLFVNGIGTDNLCRLYWPTQDNPYPYTWRWDHRNASVVISHPDHKDVVFRHLHPLPPLLCQYRDE